MSQISLRVRFLMVTSLLLVIALATNLLSLDRLRFQNTTTSEIGEVWLPAVSNSADLNINLANYRKLEFNLLATHSSDERHAVIEELDSLLGNITIYSKVLDPLLINEELRKSYDAFLASWELYQAESSKFREAIEKNDLALAESILQNSSQKQFTAAY